MLLSAGETSTPKGIANSEVKFGAFDAVHCLCRVPRVNSSAFRVKEYPSRLFCNLFEK